LLKENPNPESLLIINLNKMTDKSKELSSTIKLVNDKLQFIGFVGDNAPVSIDYIAPLGDDQGYTSLELLLLSLSSCIGSAILTLLRKMRKTITKCEIQATGLRREEHPTGFKSICMEIDLKSKDVTAEDMNKVIDMAEDKYCPVWAMIKGNTRVEINYKVTDDK
jgi:putative redox protein